MKYVITARKKGKSDHERVAEAATPATAAAIAEFLMRQCGYEGAFAWRLYKGREKYAVDAGDTPTQLRQKEAKMLAPEKLARAKRRFLEEHNALVSAAGAWSEGPMTPFGQALDVGNFELAEEILHELLRRRLGFDALEAAA